MFPRVTRHRRADEVLFRTYISSIKTFDFGPLLAGRDAELYVDYEYIVVE